MFASSRVNELKKRILITLVFLFIFRFASHVPVPGTDSIALESYFAAAGGTVFDLVNTFSGGAFKKFSVLALGIMPYITTSIIFSLLGEVIPQIQELQDDQDGIKKIQKLTRYFTVLLCAVQGYGLAVIFETFKTQAGVHVVPEPGLIFRTVATISLVGGTMFLLWLGERITEYGLENGTSLIVFTGIAVELPAEVLQKVTLFRSGEATGFSLILWVAVAIAVFYIVTFVERAFRGVSVQYAKKMVNNKLYGGTQSLPIRVDVGGVMPPILASSLLAAPATFSSFISESSPLKIYFETIQQSLYPGHLLFNIVFSLLIVYMTYFYAPIQFKTKKISEMLQRNNAFIHGVRPGAKTKEHLDYILDRITLFGAMFLIVICILPNIITGTTSRLDGTALLILVSVCIRVMINVQSFLFADKYTASGSSQSQNSKPRRF